MQDREIIAHYNEEDGKAQRLLDHLLNVSSLTGKYAKKIRLEKAGELIGLIHDLGKYSNEFQNYIKKNISSENAPLDEVDKTIGSDNSIIGTVDHSTAGAQIIWNKVFNEGKQRQIAAEVLALCIASHHSGLIDCITPDGENNFIRRINKSKNLTHIGEVAQFADNEIKDNINKLIEKGLDEVLQFLKSLICISQNEKIIKFYAGLMTRILFSCLIDADRLDTANFVHTRQASMRQGGRYIDWNVLINRLENHLKKLEAKSEKNKINNLRKKISNTCKERAEDSRGVFTLTVPTGGGKTLSSLRFALYHARKHQLDRIIYVIPFTTIIDQNAFVVREIFELQPNETGHIVLEHHSNLIPELQNQQNKLLTENWDAPVIFTTIVQFLETFFGNGTRSVRRMHQLVNSIIVFDEIQSLPVKTVHLFCNAINFLKHYCNSTIVLCTATQPLLNKVPKDKGYISLNKANEIVPDVERIFKDLKRVEIKNIIKPSGWTTEQISEFVQEKVSETGNCLVVVNTKKNAREIYMECSKNKNLPVYHLSTNMCPAHRLEKLNEIRIKLANSEPIICISTQLIEAGVDIDFDTVVRFVAGLDSIVQAAGRCNRNGKRNIGKVFIVNPANEIIDKLEDIKIGKEVTERILREMKNPDSGLPEDIIHPKVMDHFFQYYFYNREEDMVFPVDIGRNDNLLNLLSINIHSVSEYYRIENKQPEIYFRQAFKTASEKFKTIEAPTIGIIVPYSTEGKNIINELFSQFAMEKQNKLLKKAQRYTVNVFPSLLKMLIREKAIREVPGIGVLTLSDERYYHPDFGLNSEITREYNLLINGNT
ncbi:MAG: CRISPR-associated helicase Cas3' [Bacteroidales bacterium]